MLIPRFWAEARVRHRERNRQVTIRRFGWSDVSQDEAQAMAEVRANALQRAIRGEILVRRKASVPYSGVGLPIREEILETFGRSIVTRNSYGARCLNTPDVLFADLDEELPTSPWILAVTLSLAVAAAAVVGREISVVAALVVFLPAFAIFTVVALAIWRRIQGSTRSTRRCAPTSSASAPPDAEAVAHRPEAHSTADDDLAGATEKRPARDAWIARYEAASRGYAACRFLEAVGGGTVHIDIENVRRFHDEACRALDASLPIA